MSHTCNAFCRADEHCSLYYVTPGTHPDEVWQALGYYEGLRVTRCEPAREPPPPTLENELIAGNRAEATEPWLVWWC